VSGARSARRTPDPRADDPTTRRPDRDDRRPDDPTAMTDDPTAPPTDRPHRARLSFGASTDSGGTDADGGAPAAERAARVVADAVGVEEGEIDDDRSRATVRRDGTVVEVDVAAADLVALRAAANTWTGLVEVAEAAVALGDADPDRAGDASRGSRRPE
jgi:KEOPS complex subunit Pcc1